ncbi:MAG TPA: response regulator transcription factor [Blastocatellia bacterium]|nr:response regulator transcription factor [Blastocatellia bacterium]
MSDANLIKVMLIDDHAIVRAGLCMLVESHPNLKVVAQAGNRTEAQNYVTQTQPDIILLDLDLGAENGLDLLPELLCASPRSRILILTGMKDMETSLQAVRLGAMGIITKDQAGKNLLQAIHKISAGEAWLDGTITARVLTHLVQPTALSALDPEVAKIAALTQRERQIIQLVCEGLKNKLIADRLRMSEGTVRNHLTIIYEKLGVKDRFGLIVFAGRQGLK